MTTGEKRVFIGLTALLIALVLLIVWALAKYDDQMAAFRSACEAMGGHVKTSTQVVINSNGSTGTTDNILCLSSDGRILEP